MTKNKLDADALYGMAYADMQIFMLTIAPHWAKKRFGRHHLEMFRELPRGDRRFVRLNIASPRSSGKTMIVAQVYPLYRICYKDLEDYMGLRSEDYILLCSETADNPKKRIDGIKWALMNAAPPLYGDLTSRRWGSEDIETANGVLVEGIGRGSQARGKMSENRRVSLLCTDDMENVNQLNDPHRREMAKIWFFSDMAELGEANGEMNWINIDTIKHEQSITAELRKKKGVWKTLFFQAVVHPSDINHPDDDVENLWKVWETRLIDDGEEAAEAYLNENYEAMHKDVVVLWPDELPYWKVRHKMVERGKRHVMQEQQNIAIPREELVFDMEKAKTFTVGHEGFEMDGDLTSWADIAGVSTFMSYRVGDFEKSEIRGAVVSIGWAPMVDMPRKRAFVLDAWFGPTRLSDIIKEGFEQSARCLAMVSKVQAGMRMGMWDGVWKDNARQAFTAARTERGIGDRELRLEFLETAGSDIERISAMEPLTTNGLLVFREGLRRDFIEQLGMFPRDFLESADAMSGAHSMPMSFTFADRQRSQAYSASRRNAIGTWI